MMKRHAPPTLKSNERVVMVLLRWRRDVAALGVVGRDVHALQARKVLIGAPRLTGEATDEEDLRAVAAHVL
jgi:hypothetical protein